MCAYYYTHLVLSRGRTHFFYFFLTFADFISKNDVFLLFCPSPLHKPLLSNECSPSTEPKYTPNHFSIIDIYTEPTTH